MIEGAIFDLDGTLIDSMFIWDTVGEDYLRSIGKKPEENLAETLKTFTLEQTAEYFVRNYGVTFSVREIVEGINTLAEQMYKTRVVLKPGVRNFLERLRRSGVKMCIATVTDRYIAEDVLKRLRIHEFFSEIFTCAEVGSNKETPEIYRRALEHLGTPKGKTVVFEDAIHSLKTAKNDGFIVAAVYDEREQSPEEMKRISDYYITDYECFCFKKKLKTCLTIAGSDSSGGAGIQADIKTMTMNGVYAMSAVTALTAQNTLGVRAISEVTSDFLACQLDSVFEDIFPDSIKIGMVPSGELADVIAERIRHYNAKNIVVDPVMVSTSGSALIKTHGVAHIAEMLLPLATVVTPNIPEAEILADMKIDGWEDMVKAAECICKKYGCNVLLKGGHGIDNANDLLYEQGKITRFEGKRIENSNTHGTGCTLSSAIAANLAKDCTLAEAVKKAKEYVSDAIRDGLDLGKGFGPLNHAFELNP